MGNSRPSSTQRGYGYKWQKAREHFLSQPRNVLCVMCEADGRVKAASVVDHVVPHRGDLKLFWDRKNWQPLCKPCHDSRKQSIERGGSEPDAFGNDGRVVW